jgi:hypothetical protein
LAHKVFKVLLAHRGLLGLKVQLALKAFKVLKELSVLKVQ